MAMVPQLRPSGGGGVRALAICGDLMLACGRDGVVTVWQLRTGQLVRSVTGHPASAFAVGDDWFVTAGSDGTARLWETATCTPLGTVARAGTGIVAVAVAPDGTWLATVADDIQLWDMATGQLRHTLATDADSVAIAPDGTWLTTAGAEGTVRTWDSATGEPRLALTGHRYEVHAVAISPDGSWLASAGYRDVRIWHADGLPRTTLAGHHRPVRAVVIAPDSTWLATADEDGTAFTWDAETGHRRHTVPADVDAVAIAPDSDWFATAGTDGTIRLWDAVTGEHRRTLTGYGDRHAGITALAVGASLVTADGHGTVRTWDTATGRLRHTATTCDDVPFALALDGDRLVTGDYTGMVTLWATHRPSAQAEGDRLSAGVSHVPAGLAPAEQTHAGRPPAVHAPAGQAAAEQAAASLASAGKLTAGQVLAHHGEPVSAVAVGGGLVVSASHDNTVRAWHDGPLWTESSGDWTVRVIALAGTWLVTVDDGGHGRIWDATTGQVRRRFRHARAGDANWGVLAVATAPDGSWFATAGEDRAIRLWDPVTGEPLRTLTGHHDWVTALAVAPGGEWLASGGDDLTIRIWNVADGTETGVLTGQPDRITALAAPDDRRIVSGGASGATHLWDVPTGRCLATLLALADGGWAAVLPEQRYKLAGVPAGAFWYATALHRHDPSAPESEPLDTQLDW